MQVAGIIWKSRTGSRACQFTYSSQVFIVPGITLIYNDPMLCKEEE